MHRTNYIDSPITSNRNFISNYSKIRLSRVKRENPFLRFSFAFRGIRDFKISRNNCHFRAMCNGIISISPTFFVDLPSSVRSLFLVFNSNYECKRRCARPYIRAMFHIYLGVFEAKNLLSLLLDSNSTFVR